MPRTLNERIADAKEKISQQQNQMRRLLQQQKEAERKARTRRLIERGAILESLLDGAEALTNDEVKAILTAALKSGAAFDAIIPIRKRRSDAPVTEPEAEAKVPRGAEA
jgi:nitrogen fixation/metabolism regulation signal transduction histidine kinase